MKQKLEQKNPASLRREISILYDLGLETYEIEYIVYLKEKEQARHKWER